MKRLLTLLVLLAATYSLAETTADTAENPAQPDDMPNLLMHRDDAVMHHLKLFNRADEILELGSSERSFPGFYLPQQTRSPQGAALILPSEAELAPWPMLMHSLQETLAQSGWSALAINLPNIPQRSFFPNSEDDNEAKTSSAADSYQQEILTRMNAAIQFLHSKGQLNIVIIAHGQSAVWAALWLQNNALEQGDIKGIGLVLVDAFEDNYAPELIQKVLVELEFPILDVITGKNPNTALANSKRQGAMLNAQKESYLQLEFQHLTTQANDQALIRRIQGWLKTTMAGQERKIKASAPNGA